MSQERIAETVDATLRAEALSAEGSSALQQVAELLDCDIVARVAVRQHPANQVDVRVLDVRRRVRSRPLTVATHARSGKEVYRRPRGVGYSITQYCSRAITAFADPGHCVVAVEPFDVAELSGTDQDDAGRRDAADGLAAALKRLVEETLLTSPAVLVVEPIEGRQEPGAEESASPANTFDALRLSGRLSPAPAEDGHVVVSMSLYDGNELEDEHTSAPLLMSAVGEYVVRGTAELLAAHVTPDSAFVAPEDLRKQIVAATLLAGEERLYWDESQLADAGALLDAERDRLRRRGARAYAHLAEQQYEGPPQDKQQFERQFNDTVRYAMLSLARLTGALENDDLGGDPPDLPVVDFSIFQQHSLYDESHRAAITQFQRRLRDLLLGVLESPGADPGGLEELATRVVPLIVRSPDWFDESIAQSLEVRRRLLTIVAAMPSAEYLDGEILADGFSDAERKSAEVQQWYGACAESANKLLVAAVRRVSGGAGLPAAADASAAAQRDTVDQITGIHFSPVEFSIPAGSGRRTPLRRADIVQAGQGLDVVYGYEHPRRDSKGVVCVMREPGRLKPVYTAPDERGIGQACFDGKYIWARLWGPGFRLLRIQPDDGSADEYDTTLDLADYSRGHPSLGVPLDVGRVLWIGWCGYRSDKRPVQYLLTETSASGQVTTRIIHEKPYERPADDFRSQKTPNVSKVYRPLFALPLRNAETRAIEQLLIGRTIGTSGRSPCLYFDVRTHVAATVGARAPRPSGGGDYQIHKDAIYWISAWGLWRVTPDNLDHAVPLVSVPEEGCFFFAGDSVILIGKKCWLADNVYGKFRELPANLEPVDDLYSISLHNSAHYGRLLKVKRSKAHEFFKVSLKYDGDDNKANEGQSNDTNRTP